MSLMSLDFDWHVSGSDSMEMKNTMGMFKLAVNDVNLTQNRDLWSGKIQDRVFVSAYPLAMWMAASWWRLLYEPLPNSRTSPSLDWRMTHELKSANCGFIWPKVIFASDTESIQIWASASNYGVQQSVSYINSLEGRTSIDIVEFEKIAKKFIGSVINRLDSMGIPNTSLHGLWEEIQDELADTYSTKYRRFEAILGFDPDDCPSSIVEDVLSLAEDIGDDSLSELTSVLSNKVSEQKLLSSQLRDLMRGQGIDGEPDISAAELGLNSYVCSKQEPWKKASDIASLLREKMDLEARPIRDSEIFDLLGITSSEYESFVSPSRCPVSIGVPSNGRKIKFFARKKHPLAKRFELARFIGDYLLYGSMGSSWLTNTDSSTSRQKYQRAFAAEFLCPQKNLQEYMNGDYSESVIEDASDHFQVSERTIETVLANNKLIPYFQVDSEESLLPYKS